MSRALRWILAPLEDNPGDLLLMNLIYFGTAILGAAYAAIDPAAQKALLEAVGQAFSPTGTLGPVVEAYVEGQLASAIFLTFLVNLVLGSLGFLSVPSIFIPFWGVLAGTYRAALWGVLFSPATGAFSAGYLPHLLTVLLEGEAYVVAMLGVWLWWRKALTSPGRRLQAWWEGLVYQWRIYVAVAFLLAVAAIYEALEVIYLLPRLVPAS